MQASRNKLSRIDSELFFVLERPYQATFILSFGDVLGRLCKCPRIRAERRRYSDRAHAGRARAYPRKRRKRCQVKALSLEAGVCTENLRSGVVVVKPAKDGV